MFLNHIILVNFQVKKNNIEEVMLQILMLSLVRWKKMYYQ